jgi:hypothetical protein
MAATGTNKWESAAVVFRKRDGGGYYYLLQHRHAHIWYSEPGHGANLLGVPGGMRSRHDACSSDTAFREAQEETAPFLDKNLFMSAILQTVPLQKHVYFIVDADRLNTPIDWIGCVSDEVETSLFPTGHVWASETQLKTLMEGGNVLNWPALWTPVKLAIQKIWHALGSSDPAILYHGTTVACAEAILASKGFKVSNDKVVACTGCKRRPCTCGPMLGPGVYLANMDKASSNAGRAGSWAADKDDAGIIRGCVLECAVTLGNCKVAAWSGMCVCGCKFIGGVDHMGRWYPQFDSIYLEGGGPAAKRSEWCVRDPLRVVPVRFKHVWWTVDCRLVREGDWVYPEGVVAAK